MCFCLIEHSRDDRQPGLVEAGDSWRLVTHSKGFHVHILTTLIENEREVESIVDFLQE